MKKFVCMFISIVLCYNCCVYVLASESNNEIERINYTSTNIEHEIMYIPDVGTDLVITTKINSERSTYLCIYKDEELLVDHQCVAGGDSYTFTFFDDSSSSSIFKIRITDISNYGYPINAEIIAYQNHTYSKWATDYLYRAMQNKKIPQELKYNYSSNITRDDFCKIMYQLLDIDEMNVNKLQVQSRFADTDSNEINALADMGLVNGTGEGLFEPNSEITRQDIATILDRVVQKLSINGVQTSFYNAYTDEDTISGYALPAVMRMKELSIMIGKDDNNFCPKDYVTKEEAIVLLMRLLQLKH